MPMKSIIGPGSARLIISIALFLIPGMFFGQSLSSRTEIQKMISALQIIDIAYVDSVNMEKLISESISKTLKGLDPHSSYISKEDLQKANEPLEGSFEGIGVSFQLFQDTILVIAPVPGGPSERLGVLSGDKIVKINGEDATGDKIDNQWVFDRLRGKKGTTVDISIYRKGKKDLLEFTVTRDKIPLNSIDASFMATPDIGYIRLDRFSKSSMEEFNASLSKLKDQGMTKLVLDLRGNSGGFLNTAVELSDEFLPLGKLIVYTEGLKSPRQDFYATSVGGFEKGRLVIIIDEVSASASEIVAGAVQDWDRGLIIGRRSFGKGLVQKPFNLPDGSVIRLTTARYFTPTGRSIQRPYDAGTEEYHKEFLNRYDHGEYIHADSIRFPDSLKFSTPKGRVVYGGGGIMPDLFIPWDSTYMSDYYVELRRKGLINSFTLKYVESNRYSLVERYPGLKLFINEFSVEGDIMDQFFSYADTEQVQYDEDGWGRSGTLVKTQIKALIARHLWDTSAYYEIIMGIDNEFLKAIELMNDNETFKKLTNG